MSTNPSNTSIRTMRGGYKGERMKVRRFRTQDEMYKFLNTSDNAMNWREVRDNEPSKPGTYAYAGQAWHNVKTLDPSVLAHI